MGSGDRGKNRYQCGDGGLFTSIYACSHRGVRSSRRSQVESLCAQATTGGPAIMLIVNGPIREQLNINGGSNALGEGWRANATIGRCIRLIQRNIGGSYPGTTCKATLGWPGKYSLCIAENEEASPWEPLHVERGFGADTSTVTAISADSSIRASDLDSTTGKGILTNFARRMDGPSG